MNDDQRYILAALRDDVLSPYQIRLAVQEGAEYTLTMARTFEMLLELLDEHMIARAGWQNNRKVYAITPFGRAALDREEARV